MNTPTPGLISFLVTRAPYQQRSARSDVDFVLAALAMEQTVRVFFLGSSVLQLAAERQLDGSGLSKGYKSWSALPDFGEAAVYAEPAWLESCAEQGVELVLPVIAVPAVEMNRHWNACANVVVL